MSKLPFFSWDFSNTPINFLKEKVTIKENQIQENIKIMASSDNIIENNQSSLDVDISQWNQDVQWISNIEQLELIIKKYSNYFLVEGGNKYYIGEGSWQKIMIIADYPVIYNDQLWSFTGEIKDLLIKMLHYINIDINNCYLTTLSPWISHNNQTLNGDQLNKLSDLMMKHIEIIQPKKILLLGNTVAQTLLKKSDPFNNLRGHKYELMGIPTVISWHPKFLDKFKNFKKQAAEDMQLFSSID